MNPMQFAINSAGGPAKAAEICEISVTAIQKMKKKGCLPRTEYTGKTQYAQLLSNASAGAFAADWLLAEANPDRASECAKYSEPTARVSK